MGPGWDDLRVFLTVAREGSLSGAGAVLQCDPATAGRRIARLEAAIGAALFVKSPQGYMLTDAGERMLPHAAEAEAAAMQAEDAVRGQDGRLAGTIRVGAPDGCANFLLPGVLAAIAAENPGLEVQVLALPRLFNLDRREADMAVGVSAPAGGRLAVQRIGGYRLVLAASRPYLAAAPPIREPEDLKGHRVIGYIPQMIFDKELDYLGMLGVERAAMASNSVAVQLRMAEAGAGLAMVHDFALPAAPGLVPVLPGRIALARAFYLIRHADDLKVRRLTRFADLLVAGMRRALAGPSAALTGPGAGEDAGRRDAAWPREETACSSTTS